MTRNDFASLGSSAWSLVVAKRQALVAANKAEQDALDDYLDNCPCPERACTCGRDAASRKASKARSEAYHDAAEAEAMWAQYCEIRRADIERRF